VNGPPHNFYPGDAGPEVREALEARWSDYFTGDGWWEVSGDGEPEDFEPCYPEPTEADL
jgi:hypothetical protein